jgi:uncharacterized protein with FMN-binding domain
MGILATIVGTTLLVGLKAYGSPTSPTLSAEAPLDPATTGAPGAPPGSDPAAPVGPSASQSASPGSTATLGPGQSPTGLRPTTAAAPTAPRPSTAAPPPATTSRTLSGSAVAASSYGSMQVSIVATGTHIDSIATIKQSNRPGSTASKLTPLALSAQAVPTAACKTTVSGATYSCEAWKQSLQSAIAKM